MEIFEDARKVSRADLAAWLRQMADQLESDGKVRFGAGGSVSVGDEVDCELEIESSGSETSIEIEFSWTGSSATAQAHAEEEEEEAPAEVAPENVGPSAAASAAEPVYAAEPAYTPAEEKTGESYLSPTSH
ncbi:amphi-Trp domain-containing protein [Catelliglobosispora koreensis]|uniref:amphi-Trp domain-containing protein n=1 Tax=Catelliglobosispora koreensis TaxID=129052 RepID=UPI0012F8C36F|nr:amphi-Trp domain-containing protein [Catelliglobosispora koreensis]